MAADVTPHELRAQSLRATLEAIVAENGQAQPGDPGFCVSATALLATNLRLAKVKGLAYSALLTDDVLSGRIA